MSVWISLVGGVRPTRFARDVQRHYIPAGNSTLPGTRPHPKYNGAWKGDLIDVQLRMVDNQGHPAIPGLSLFSRCSHARPQEELLRGPDRVASLACRTSPGRDASRSFPPEVALHRVKIARERPDEYGRSLAQWAGSSRGDITWGCRPRCRGMPPSPPVCKRSATCIPGNWRRGRWCGASRRRPVCSPVPARPPHSRGSPCGSSTNTSVRGHGTCSPASIRAPGRSTA